MSKEIIDYISRVTKHLYLRGSTGYKVYGAHYSGLIEEKGFSHVTVYFDEIYFSEYLEDEMKLITGINTCKTYTIDLTSTNDKNKLQRVKNVMRRKFTRKSCSIRKKLWTKLVKELKSVIK